MITFNRTTSVWLTEVYQSIYIIINVTKRITQVRIGFSTNRNLDPTVDIKLLVPGICLDFQMCFFFCAQIFLPSSSSKSETMIFLHVSYCVCMCRDRSGRLEVIINNVWLDKTSIISRLPQMKAPHYNDYLNVLEETRGTYSRL